MLDFKMPGMDTPEGQGLLAAAFSLLQARKMPGDRGIGGALGQAGQQYMGTRSQAQEQMQRRKLQDLQMSAAQRQLEAQQAAERQRAADEAAVRGSIQGGSFDPRQFLQANPTASLGALEQGMKFNSALNPARKFTAYKPGDVIMDESDPTKPVFAVPDRPEKPAELPSSVREFEYGQNNPAFNQWLSSQNAAKGTRVNVSNVTKQEGEESKAVGKFFGDAYADVQKAGFEAESKINRYSRLGQLLNGVSTGTFTPTGLEVAKAAAALGVNIDPNMQNKEAAQALSSEIALQLRNPSGGAGMPGAMSDADRQFLANMVPGLATTPEGRKLMIETASKLAQRDKEVAAMARKYRQRKGNIDEGFYDELAKFSTEKPLFKGSSGSPNVDSLVDKYRSK